MKLHIVTFLSLAGCASSQAHSAPPPESAPVYTTSDAPQHQHGAAEGTHVMPDGTVMPGHSHGGHEGHAPGTHVMPDGTVMPGHSHAEHEGAHTHGAHSADAGAPADAATHVMPDGAVMPGAHHHHHQGH